MNKYSKEITLFTGIFSLLFPLSFSFPFSILPDVGGWLEPSFSQVAVAVGGAFGIKVEVYHSGEDSLGMAVNTVVLLLLSAMIYAVLTYRLREEVKESMITYARVWIRYYLATMLLIYGFDKVYKWQFYSPESNILYTRVKDLPQDMLYWTTMGTSYAYSLFGGLLEVLAGVLLLFRKTHVIGAFLGAMVLGNVFAVNIGFDITVKLFSGFLLCLNLVLLSPYMVKMTAFFTGRQASISLNVTSYSKSKSYKPLKVIILLIILVESQFKYVKAGNFNDDLAPRPHFNGVYEVIEGGEDIVRIHFHRHGYFILEMNDAMFLDYKLDVNESKKTFILTDYSFNKHQFQYTESTDTLWLKSVEGTFRLVAVKRPL